MFGFLCNCCRKKIIEQEYVNACKNGLINIMKLYLQENPRRDVNPDLLLCTEYGQKDAIDYLITEQEAILLDPAVKIASEKGYLQLVDLLLKKGANPVVAMRYAKSNNIISLIHRYREKIEVVKP